MPFAMPTFTSDKCAKCSEKFKDGQTRHKGPKGTVWEKKVLCAFCWYEAEGARRNEERKKEKEQDDG